MKINEKLIYWPALAVFYFFRFICAMCPMFSHLKAVKQQFYFSCQKHPSRFESCIQSDNARKVRAEAFLLFARFIEETVAWLIQANRLHKAAKVLKTISRVNDVQTEIQLPFITSDDKQVSRLRIIATALVKNYSLIFVYF